MALKEKLNKTTREFYLLFVKGMPKWTKWVNAFHNTRLILVLPPTFLQNVKQFLFYGMISTTYHKYSKFFIENIPSSSVLCFENLLKEFFNLDSEVFVDCSFFFFFCNEKLCTCFWKKLGLFSKNIKVFKDSNSAGFIVLLWNFSDAFSLEIPKKSVKKIVFFPDWYILENKTKTKQKNPQKVFEVLLLTIYLVICRKNIVNLL